MSGRAAVIEAMAAVVPSRRVDNHHFERTLDTTDAWIQERTGITSRRWATPEVSTGDLGVAAARAARHRAHGPVDAVIVCTTTPDHVCPATAPALAHRLGIDDVAAFDLNAACSGFVYGLSVASALLLAGTSTRVLLVCSEVLSRISDERDRGTAILFGDAAAATVLTLGDADAPGAVGALDWGSDGGGLSRLQIPAGGSRRPFDAHALAERADRLRMDGQAVYRHAVERMTASARRCLERAGMQARDLDRFVGHQANARILAAVGERLGLEESRQFSDVAHYGNTSSASVPLAMCDLSQQDPPPAGAPVLTTAFGAGFTWGSALLRWPDPSAIAAPVDHRP